MIFIFYTNYCLPLHAHLPSCSYTNTVYIYIYIYICVCVCVSVFCVCVCVDGGFRTLEALPVYMVFSGDEVMSI